MPSTQAPATRAGISIKTVIRKALTLVVIGVALGWIYAWASPQVFPREVQAGAAYGVAHGALMPMALPSLLMGQDVEIYAANNSGRAYKIGYIVGINLCGLIVFGSAFWRPARKPSAPGGVDGEAQRNQLR